MSSSLLAFYFEENTISFCCIALGKKTRDLYKYSVEYFLLKISVISSPPVFF